jgi:hypothetical protein
MTVTDELKRIGAVLIRQKRHQVWSLPDGRKYVMSQTPSDWRAEQKQLSMLRRLLKPEHV